jgi:hypothetical protein
MQSQALALAMPISIIQTEHEKMEASCSGVANQVFLLANRLA